MTFEPGTALGPYVIRRALGAGGMGEVYVAHDGRLNRDVAVKVLPASFATDADRLRRFEQEARAASALNHPAIISVYDIGHVAGRPYLCMELVQGETLQQLLSQGALPLKRVLAIAAQVADGLAKAHDAGIVHRDLKPDNIMVTVDGFAKILDFGLAKLVDSATSTAETMVAPHTHAGTVLGTVGYMSPEQASGQAADIRSDQFAFGAVLYEMITGRRAFDKPTAVETLTAIVRDEVQPVQALQPSTPVPVSWIVERCLQKQPSERYGSTRDLARDLANARDRLSELTATGVTPRASLASRPRVRELAAWGLAAALGILALALWLQRGAAVPAPGLLRFTFAAPAGGRFTSTLSSSPFAISPDGRHIVFISTSATGVQSLWIRPVDSLQARPLPGTDGATGPFWSPDSEHVGFFTFGQLKRVAIDGGDATTITETRGGGAGASWNMNNIIVFAPTLESGLSRVPAAGGGVTPATELDESREESSHFSPVFLSDGNHFVFRLMGRRQAGTYVAALDAPAPQRLSDEESMLAFGAGHLFFMQGRALMARRLDETRLQLTGEPIRVASDVEAGPAFAGFAVSASGTVAYWPGSVTVTRPTWVSRAGAVLGSVGPPGAYGTIALSPDAMEVAVERFDLEPAIWRLDIHGGVTRATRGSRFQSTPVWRPDGQAIVYAALVSTPPNLFLKRLDREADDVRLFFSRVQCFPQSWSADGRTLVYATSNPNTGNDLWLLEMSGVPGPDGYPRRPLIVTPFNEREARLSPDGVWLAYSSNESGAFNVYVAPLAQPARKRPVSVGGGRFPIWSRDGRELYYIDRQGQLTAVPIRSTDGLQIGAPFVLFDAQATPATLGLSTPYDVAPDGRFLINRGNERTAPPATVIVNWQPPMTPH